MTQQGDPKVALRLVEDFHILDQRHARHTIGWEGRLPFPSPPQVALAVGGSDLKARPGPRGTRTSRSRPLQPPPPDILTLSTPTRWDVLVALDGTFSPIFNPPKILRSAPRKQTSDLC